MDLNEVFGERGILSRRIPTFRYRPQQLAMAEGVAQALRENRHLLVEAPTGVGKSLAYLVPILLHAVDQGQRVVVSTHTIALQDQLLGKDLPLLDACLPVEFVPEKALGRRNYLGLRRLGIAMGKSNALIPGDQVADELRRISDWSQDAMEGRRQELNPQPRPTLWDLVQSEGDNCLGRRCPNYEPCFFQSARRRLFHAQVIVTNHAFYCTDLALRKEDAGILPPHDVLVVDEAHRLEEVATEHLGLEVSRRGTLRVLGRIAGTRSMPGLLDRLPESETEPTKVVVREAMQAAARFFASIDRWIEDRPASNGRIREVDFVYNEVDGPLMELQTRLRSLSVTQTDESLALELTAAANRTHDLAATTRFLLSQSDPDLVYFVERNESRGETALLGQALNIADTLRADLFEQMKSVILTSATLSTRSGKDALGFTQQSLGCDSALTHTLSSPFDLEQQVEMEVARDLPAPTEPEFVETAAARTLDAILEAGGGAFVLFTSYQMLGAFHRILKPRLDEEGIRVFRQGEDLDRTEMLRRFRADGNAVILGAESFWEGVDIPGSALRLVIITRLPFPVPTAPLHEAKSERLAAQGRSAFSKLSLPIAVLKFRQGFGRLIRSEEDRGKFLCLDSRVAHKSYGARFLKALMSKVPPSPKS